MLYSCFTHEVIKNLRSEDIFQKKQFLDKLSWSRSVLTYFGTQILVNLESLIIFINLKNFIFILEYLKFVNKSTILATGKMEADTLNFVH